MTYIDVMQSLISGKTDLSDYALEALDDPKEMVEFRDYFIPYLNSAIVEEKLYATYILTAWGFPEGFHSAINLLKNSIDSEAKASTSIHRLFDVDESFKLLPEALGISAIDSDEPTPLQQELMRLILNSSNEIYFGDYIASPLMFVKNLKNRVSDSAAEAIKRNLERIKSENGPDWLKRQTLDIAKMYSDILPNEAFSLIKYINEH